MSVGELLGEQWLRRALAVVLVLVVLSPVFAWAAGQVGYTEPLELAAEDTGATDEAEALLPAILPDYTVPGLPTYTGTLVSGVVGTAAVLVIGYGIGRLLPGSETP